MPKFLFTVRHSELAMELVKDHGLDEAWKATSGLMELAGGTLEQMYLSFDDGPRAWIIGDLPDLESANALCVFASRGPVVEADGKLVHLLTLDDVRKASSTQKAWPRPEAPTLPAGEVPSANKPIEGVGTAVSA